jgi:hypothetical protein
VTLSSGFLNQCYRLFFNNMEEVKVLLLPGGSWREPGFVRGSEIGLDCIAPFSP